MRSYSLVVAIVIFVVVAQCLYLASYRWPTAYRSPLGRSGMSVVKPYRGEAPQPRPEVQRNPAAGQTKSLQSLWHPGQLQPCPLTKVSMLYGAHTYSQLEAALDSHRRHCSRWNCGFESLEQDLTDRKLYSKHYFLLSTMLHELSKPEAERKEWLMWVDADSILINPALSPCAFLPPADLEDVFAVVSADHQGLNNGIFYLRVHRSSVDLLTETVAYPLVHPDEDLGWFGEQAAMAKVINATELRLRKEKRPPGIAWVPRDWFNSYESQAEDFEAGFEGKPGSFIVHFAGLAETRLSQMAQWLDELQVNQAKWEKPLEDTPYMISIPRFWKQFAANSTTKS